MNERFKRFRYLMKQVETVARDRLQNCKFAEHAGVNFTPETQANIQRIELIINAIERRNVELDRLIDAVEVRQEQAVDEMLKSKLRLSVDAVSDLIGTDRSDLAPDTWQAELEELLATVESVVGLTYEKKQNVSGQTDQAVREDA